MSKKTLSIFTDIIGIAGGASITYGAYILHESVGYLVGGILAIIFAIAADKQLTNKNP